MNSRTKYGVLSLILFVFIWEGYVRFFSVPAFILPMPTAVFSTIIELLTDSSFYIHILYDVLFVLCFAFSAGFFLYR